MIPNENKNNSPNKHTDLPRYTLTTVLYCTAPYAYLASLRRVFVFPTPAESPSHAARRVVTFLLLPVPQLVGKVR